MSYETVEIEYADGIATLWMNRPTVHNAFNAQLIADLDAACRALGADDRVRAVVLAGRGKSFSAGADLNWMKQAAGYTVEENLADARRLAGMLRTLAELPKPTVARVHGAALGGGTGLAAACDICIAAEQAVFATSEVRFGIIPSAISPYVLRAIGPRQALRYFQSGERIDARRALVLGLAHEVCPAEQLDETIARLLESLLLGGPTAQGAAKSLVGAVWGQPISEHIVEETARRIAYLRSGAEAAEGLSAFLAKRPPAWAPQPG